MTALPDASLRLDRWLWHARVFKTKAGAAKAVQEDGVRITRTGQTQRCEKPSFGVRVGDMVALSRGRRVLVLEVVALGERRGPSAEARALYADHSPPPPPREVAPPPVFERGEGAGRPTKKDRRALDALREQED
ncbi:RNA-binding S4 domain-containing protein [Parvularcula dongshanensis]|uniref:Ribosome-associated heat shock protein Hsp15 n=1 Tax=Parvularcula dongshanensis TaxID=1173995 RepID=A0A840I259_9PROT|nr:RNA-binding S4 domain-containing protein [Parvularcula dongshanensis]MBB4658362.1 ribosome-associated heat shock protein Hsp15 [Parvularcula dongshanensis]